MFCAYNIILLVPKMLTVNKYKVNKCFGFDLIAVYVYLSYCTTVLNV